MHFQIDNKAEGRVTYRLHKIFRDVNKNIFNFRIQLFIRINLQVLNGVYQPNKCIVRYSQK